MMFIRIEIMADGEDCKGLFPDLQLGTNGTTCFIIFLNCFGYAGGAKNMPYKTLHPLT